MYICAAAAAATDDEGDAPGTAAVDPAAVVHDEDVEDGGEEVFVVVDAKL